MTDPYGRPEASHPETGDGRASAVRRWLKIIIIAVAILVVLFVVMGLLGGGHGPSRHMGGSGLN